MTDNLMKNIFSNRIAKNSASLFVVQIFQYATPLIFLLIISKRLGLAGFSELSLALIIIQFIGIVIEYGFYLSATERLARTRDHRQVGNYILGSVLVGKFIILIAMVLILLLISKFTSVLKISELTVYYSLLPILANSLLPIWFFQGIEKLHFVMIFVSSAKLVSLLLIVLTVQRPEDMNLVLVINGITIFLAAFFLYYIIMREGYKPLFRRKHAVKMVFYGFQFFLARLASSMYTTVNGIIIGMFLPISNVGIYSVSNQFYAALQGIYQPIYQSVYPYMSRERNLRLLVRILLLIVLSMLLVVPIAFIIVPLLVEQILVSDYAPVAMMFPYFLFAFVANVLSSFAGYPLFVIMKKNALVNYTLYFGSLFHFFGIVVFIMLDMLNVKNIILLLGCTELSILTMRLVLFYRLKMRKINDE